jgi:hypothetical protein
MPFETFAVRVKSVQPAAALEDSTELNIHPHLADD